MRCIGTKTRKRIKIIIKLITFDLGLVPSYRTFETHSNMQLYIERFIRMFNVHSKQLKVPELKQCEKEFIEQIRRFCLCQCQFQAPWKVSQSQHFQ